MHNRPGSVHSQDLGGKIKYKYMTENKIKKTEREKQCAFHSQQQKASKNPHSDGHCKQAWQLLHICLCFCLRPTHTPPEAPPRHEPYVIQHCQLVLRIHDR
jgi:hypothetical protein